MYDGTVITKLEQSVQKAEHQQHKEFHVDCNLCHEQFMFRQFEFSRQRGAELRNIRQDF